MKSIPNQLVAYAGSAALTAAGLFAAVTHNRPARTETPAFISSADTVLGMKTQPKPLSSRRGSKHSQSSSNWIILGTR